MPMTTTSGTVNRNGTPYFVKRLAVANEPTPTSAQCPSEITPV